MPQQPLPHLEIRPHARRRRGAGAPLRWVPSRPDGGAQRIVDSSLRSACALVGAHGGFVVLLREARQLEIIGIDGLTRSQVLDAVLGSAAPVLHGALLEGQCTTNSAQAESGSVIAVPLELREACRGALCVLRGAGQRALGALDFEILATLAGQTGLALGAESRRADGASDDNGLAVLTAREHEVFALVVQARTTKEIARVLAIGVKTAENHRAHMMEKLGLRNTAEVVRFAALRGLLD